MKSQNTIPPQFAIVHRALAISEILDQILRHVHMKSDMDALSLGLACRAYIEPVLDALRPGHMSEKLQPETQC
jgi:hypothetical protein